MTKKTLTIMAFALMLVATACTTAGGGQEAEGTGEAALPETSEAVAAGGEETEPQGGAAEEGGSVLDAVKSRGRLTCGVNSEVPGFGFTDEEGNFSGFDIDFCRVVAAGVLGDSEAVDFVPLTAEQRFTALQSGEIDVLIRNTTWTSSRDGGEGAAFATTTFYDGQTMMVKADSEFSSIDDMDGTDICVLSGTTTELNLASEFSERGLEFEAITFEDNDQLLPAFRQGRCDGWTSDASQLAGVRSAWPESEGGPEALTIFEDEIFSKEPLGPAVADGDMAWYDAVNWSVIATMQAEEFELTSDNVEDMAETSEDPDVLRFLGRPSEEEEAVFEAGLGLPNDFALQIVSQVGNYAEIYESNLEPLDLERGRNALYTEGGLHYPPPFR